MACKLPGYAGRTVLLEYFLACGDVDPRDPNISWAPIGPMTTKAFNLTWETSDVSTDQTVGNLMANIATWQSLEISGSGIATPQDGTRTNLTKLTKHIANPGVDFSNQPVIWLRMTFPDLTFIAYCIATTISRDAPSGEPVTYEFSATATESDFGLIVMETPNPDAPDVTSIELVPSTLTMLTGQTFDIEGVVLPAGAPQNISWSTSDPDIATVHTITGVVTAVRPGTVTITGAAVANPSMTDTVTVTIEAMPLAIDVVPSTLEEMVVAETEQITATVQPTGSSQAVNYVSSNPLVATVSPSGLVTAVGSGTATITVSAAGKPSVFTDIPLSVE